MPNALRASIEVHAGVIPGQPIPKYSKRWDLISDVWEREDAMSDEEFAIAHPDGKSTFFKMNEAAHEYARTLQDPRSFNWVRVDWVWY
jgi:hypothetical protein